MNAATMSLQASDVSGQRSVRASGIPGDSTISELLNGLLAKMGLSRHDAVGRPVRYRARLEREGRQLHGHERVSEALQPGDHVILAPNIDAASAGC